MKEKRQSEIDGISIAELKKNDNHAKLIDIYRSGQFR